MTSDRTTRAVPGIIIAGVLLGAVLAVPAGAQPGGEPVRAGTGFADTVNRAGVMFDRLLSTYRWQLDLVYGSGTDDFRYDIRQLFRSSLVRTNTNLITDEETFSAGFRFLPGRTLEPRLVAGSFILSDRRGLGLSDVSSHSLRAGVAYRPSDNVMIAPSVGVRADRQIDNTDRGLSTLLEIAADSLLYEGYRSALSGSWQYDRLDPRTIETRNLSVTTLKTFPGNSSNALSARYFRGRRDFYTPADDRVKDEFLVEQNIETRTESGITVTDSLLYRVSPDFIVAVNAGLFSRGIDRSVRYRSYANPERPALDTRVEELSINGELNVRYAVNSRVDAGLSMVLQERNETHLAVRDDGYLPAAVDSLRRVQERKNNVSRRTTLAAQTEIRLSRSDTVSFSCSGTILRYDTPSGLNTDDRDDLWYILNLTTRHRFNRYLHLEVRSDASLMHLVYLSSRRSADNTWNRIFRLSPAVTYTPSASFTTANRFEVLANYTVYDFELEGSPVRSFSFRQFAFSDSTVVAVSRRSSVVWRSTVRIYQRGNLRWNDFTEQPVGYFEDFLHWGEIRYRPVQRLIFSLGIRYFSQLRFGYLAEKRVLERFFRSIGPTTGIEWQVSGRTALSFHGWYEHQSQTGLPDNGIANMSMSLNINL